MQTGKFPEDIKRPTGFLRRLGKDSDLLFCRLGWGGLQSRLLNLKNAASASNSDNLVNRIDLSLVPAKPPKVR
jgi:hypothetical protein